MFREKECFGEIIIFNRRATLEMLLLKPAWRWSARSRAPEKWRAESPTKCREYRFRDSKTKHELLSPQVEQTEKNYAFLLHGDFGRLVREALESTLCNGQLHLLWVRRSLTGHFSFGNLSTTLL